MNRGNVYYKNDFLQSMGQFFICIPSHVNSAWHITSAQSLVAINVISYYHSGFQMQMQIIIIL